jgi:ABC-type sugar transport system ATPase subunit
LQSASVRFADGTAVELPDLSLETGQELALVGPSGSAPQSTRAVNALMERLLEGYLKTTA